MTLLCISLSFKPQKGRLCIALSQTRQSILASAIMPYSGRDASKWGEAYRGSWGKPLVRASGCSASSRCRCVEEVLAGSLAQLAEGCVLHGKWSRDSAGTCCLPLNAHAIDDFECRGCQ